MVLGGALTLVGCNGDDTSSTGATATATATDGTATTLTASGTDTATASGTGSATDSTSQGSDSQTGTGTATDSSGSASATDSATTTDSASATGSSGSSSATGSGGSTTATTGTGGTSGSSGTSGGSGSTGGVTAGSTGGVTATTGAATTGGNCGGMGPAMFDFSYIWISNSPAGTVSKIDTKTAVEVARYTSGPAGKQDPSRTSVSSDGKFAVAVNRQGGITMFAAEEDDCVDKNNNNQIDTSTGPNDVLPWGTDECQIWNVELPATGSSGPRPVSWNIGPLNQQTCLYETGDVWVGWYSGNTGVFRLLNGEDGMQITEVQVPNWSGENWGPYGGGIDSDNNFWVTGWGNNGPVVKIDGMTYQATHYGSAGDWIYGMGLDLDGNTWAAGCGNGTIHKFDKALGQWTTKLNLGNYSCLRGLQVDKEGRAFVATNGPCGLAVVDTKTDTIIDGSVPIAGCSTPVGVSIDAEGYVWVVDRTASMAFKIDPDNYSIVDTVSGLVSPYTYSDMTGAGLQNAILPQ